VLRSSVDDLTREAGLPPRGGLLERDESRERLSDAAAAAGAGHGSLVVVLGRPGEGKSALLDEACAIGERRGLRTLRAWGSSLERGFAFGVARQLFSPVLSELPSRERAEVLSGGARLAGGVLDLEDRPKPLEPSAARNGLFWLLLALARIGPLLLALDDAHWADEASLVWLAGCMRRLNTLPVLALVATRQPAFDGSGDALGAIVSAPEVPVLTVSPLTRPSIATLITRELGVVPDERVLRRRGWG
jgi:predicted ATPase